MKFFFLILFLLYLSTCASWHNSSPLSSSCFNKSLLTLRGGNSSKNISKFINNINVKSLPISPETFTTKVSKTFNPLSSSFSKLNSLPSTESSTDSSSISTTSNSLSTSPISVTSISTSSPPLIDFKSYFSRLFLPSGDLNPSYYRYAVWRLIQRSISATNTVFATQALLFALGVGKSSTSASSTSASTRGKNAALSLTTSWLSKDAFGKISKIFCASAGGRSFDVDAKRWRARSAILYSMGNLLELLTSLLPTLYVLPCAAIANSWKQMAILVYSATRSAIYKSFSPNGDNIGDITAKGEAQVAVVDLLGMIVGVAITSAVVGAPGAVSAFFFALFLFLDIYGVFKEIGSVVYDTLNYERSDLFIQNYLASSLSSLSSSTTSTDSTSLLSSLSPNAIASKERLIFYDSIISSSLFDNKKKNKEKKNEGEKKNFLSLQFYNQYFIIKIYYKKMKKNIFSLIYYSLLRTLFGNIFCYVKNDSLIIITPSLSFHNDKIPGHSSSINSPLDFSIEDYKIEEDNEEKDLVNKVATSSTQSHPTFTASLENISILKSIIILRHFLFNIENNLLIFDKEGGGKEDEILKQKLQKILSNSIKFEKKNFPNLYSLLKESGWNVNNFLYGAFNNK